MTKLHTIHNSDVNDYVRVKEKKWANILYDITVINNSVMRKETHYI
jgi:hypothetical protein